jgi:ADP-ribose pyrophosphatase YjhB (NUDIX family)
MIDPEVTPVGTCILKAGAGTWEFARSHAGQIDAHWQRRSASNPAFFNGRIYMLADYRISGGTFAGELIQVEFKQFLYWKDTGCPDKTVFDVFGSGLIRSRDGAVLLGRQRPGNLNEGLVYLPGGFIDPRDTDEEGRVDIRASVLREVQEETGLDQDLLTVRDGVLVTTIGQQVSIAVDLVSGEDGQSLQARVRRALSGVGDSELDDVILVRSLRDLAGSKVPEYADVLLRRVLVPSI